MTITQIGAQVRLFAPMSAHHGATCTVVRLLPSAADPRTAEVQLDGLDECVLVHRSALRPVSQPKGSVA